MPRLPSLPKIKPASDWKAVLRHAWSVRLLAIAAVLSGAEAILPLVGLPLPYTATALITGAVTAAAFVARLTAQKHLSGSSDE